jgi:hypothetical protein
VRARGQSVKTMVSDKAAPCPVDHVNRQFKVPPAECNIEAGVPRPLRERGTFNQRNSGLGLSAERTSISSLLARLSATESRQ